MVPLFPRTIKALGREWKMPAEHDTVDIVLQFRDWIKEQEGDPYAEAAQIIKLLDSEEEQKRIVKEAKEIADQLRCFTLKCPLAEKWFKTPDGGRQFVYLMLQVHQPEITLSEATAVAMEWGKCQSKQPRPEGNGLSPTEAVPLVGSNI